MRPTKVTTKYTKHTKDQTAMPTEYTEHAETDFPSVCFVGTSPE